MKFYSLLFLFMLSCNENKTAIKNKNMGDSSHIIMHYNVENLFDTFDDPNTFDDDFLPDSPKEWDEQRFKHKLYQLSDVIMGIDAVPPTLIGMVEIENAYVLDQLCNNIYLKRFNYGKVHHESPDERGIDVALLYDKDKFEVVEHFPIAVYLEDNDKNT